MITRKTAMAACCFVIIGLAVTLLFGDGEPKRIWCLGDSITLGKGFPDGQGGLLAFPSYRYQLYKSLTAAGWNVNFIGTQTGFGTANGWTQETCLAEYPDWQDQQHDGWSGYTSSQILNGDQWGSFAGVDDLAASMNPDIVLLHIGANDAYKGLALSETQQSIEGIMQAVRNANPNVEIYVAATIPCASDKDFYDELELISSWIANNIENYSTEASPVHMVDVHTGYDNVNWYVPSYTVANDGVHPNNSGEEFMADRWFTAMNSDVPEPATVCLLTCAFFALSSRKRKTDNVL